jgi:DNA repair ATPase RecN
MEMDAARFRELVKRRDAAHKKMEEAQAAQRSATEALESATRQLCDAANNLQDYVQECAGDPHLGSYRR